MPNYQYKAKDGRGKAKSGELSAPSKQVAKQQLRRMNLKSIQLKTAQLDRVDDFTGRQWIVQGFLYKDAQGNVQISIGEKAWNFGHRPHYGMTAQPPVRLGP